MPEDDSNNALSGNSIPGISNEFSTDSPESIARLDRAPLISAAARVTRDHSAEDIVQSVYEILLSLLLQGRLRNIRCLRAFAVRIAKNSALKQLRRRKRERIVHRLVESEELADDPADLVSAQQIVDQQLARLPEKLRAAYLLCFFYGYSDDEAAARLNITVSGLRKRLSRLEKFFDPVPPDSEAVVTESSNPSQRKERK